MTYCTQETRSVVVAADRGREFAFVVGGSWVRWGYTFTPVGIPVTLAALKKSAESG
ncbi:MAG TPA: hypothetical protein VGS06_37860 [Streptosporangiaceae bacterium]|nr:hypothetical protein [Streptosporangiaceae bacterium]